MGDSLLVQSFLHFEAIIDQTSRMDLPFLAMSESTSSLEGEYEVIEHKSDEEDSYCVSPAVARFSAMLAMNKYLERITAAPGLLDNVFKRNMAVEKHFEECSQKPNCILEAVVRYPPYMHMKDAQLTLTWLAKGGYRLAWEAKDSRNAGHKIVHKHVITNV